MRIQKSFDCSACGLAVAAALLVSGCSFISDTARLVNPKGHGVASTVSESERDYVLAKAMLSQHRPEEALQVLDRLLSKNPGHVEGLNVRASIRAARSEWLAARQDLDRALELASDREHLRFNLDLLKRQQAAADASAKARATSELQVIRVPPDSSRSDSLVERPAEPQVAPVALTGSVHQSIVRIPDLSAAVNQLKANENVVTAVGAVIEPYQDPASAPAVVAIAPPTADKARIDIANGNGVIGFAQVLYGHLRASGLPIATVSNWGRFNQPVTRILYREGHEQMARDVAQRLPVQVELVATERLYRANTDIVIVLGRDLRFYRPSAGGWTSLGSWTFGRAA